MVRSALPRLPLPQLGLVIIGNVGNLVCPAEFGVEASVTTGRGIDEWCTWLKGAGAR